MNNFPQYKNATGIGMGYSQQTCDRCGQGIMNWFHVGEHFFGSECIKHVVGIEADTIENNIKREKRESDPAWIEKQAKRIKEEVEFEAKKAKYTVKNQWLIEFLRSESKYLGDFCYNMANELEYTSTTDISDKAFNIMGDMYAKVNGGRKNSKKWNEAWDRFEELANEGVEEESAVIAPVAMDEYEVLEASTMEANCRW